MAERADIVVVGAGAAGLFAAIWAGRALREAGLRGRVVALDGARKVGAKILVAGGGRCNVTHHAVDETAYAGSSRASIRNVLRRFWVERTVSFFEELGVELKREETGKLFPVTDDAQTVLDALLRAGREAGVEMVHPWRVGAVRREGDAFAVVRERGKKAEGDLEEEKDLEEDRIVARRVVVATGGKALPKTGSDGFGFEIVRLLGHSVTELWPALVPLVLDDSAKWIKELSGLTVPATIELWSGTGKKMASFTNSTLCTHFGVSGPGVLDISRYYTGARRSDPAARLTMNWLPGMTFDAADAWLAERASVAVGKRLGEKVPERLARGICASAGVGGVGGVDAAMIVGNLRREQRREVARRAVATELPVSGDRGYTHAEATAGGVPLGEVHLETMESRVCPGLHLCGEILDVDGRIGGFNFQWAWASGFVAGMGVAGALGEKKNAE